ncbi:hypothetical protein Hdeb2414_s0009g00317751 [Helianthus debilis subsp. tardiflorus]
MDTIRVCKSDWDRSDRDSFFQGRLTVLVLLYLDSTTCLGFAGERLEPPISFWTKDMISLRKDLEIKNGGFGLGDVRELRLEEAGGQLAARFPNSECLLPVLEWYKMMFNKSVVDDKGEPSCVKSDVERKKDDVSMKGNKNSGVDEGDGFLTPHVASTFTQNVIVYTNVLKDVLSGAYETQRRDGMPSFDLGLSQPLPSTQEVLTLREETVKNVEPEADVGGKGKRKKQVSKYGNSPFLL